MSQFLRGCGQVFFCTFTTPNNKSVRRLGFLMTQFSELFILVLQIWVLMNLN